jgi:AcrR family transcriptional regulator
MEKEKIDKKDHIMDVAERVFAEHGFDGASTRLISGEAGVNMAMLNYYFGSKEGLLIAIFERRTSTFRSLIQNIGNNEEMTSWQKVSEYIEAYINRVFNHNCFQKVIHQEMTVRRTGELADKITDMIMQNVLELRKILYLELKVRSSIRRIFHLKRWAMTRKTRLIWKKSLNPV